MTYSGFSTVLSLAYPPLSNHDFTILRSDKEVQSMLAKSMLYIISQRCILTFENLSSTEDGIIRFEIRQVGNDEILLCHIDINQEAIRQDIFVSIEMEIGSHDQKWDQKTLPAFDIDGIKFYGDGEFLLWLTPEKFIYDYLHGKLKAKIEGNISSFSSYKVHYVGKATDQHIWDRLTGHSKLSDILSLQNPFRYGSLPTHEIVLLLFSVSDAISLRIIDPEQGFKTFVSRSSDTIHPTEKEVSLDAEKLLIKLLAPEYNDPKKRFPNYPKSSDGLFKYNFDRFAYQILEELTLIYPDGKIECSLDRNKSDILAIDDNESVHVVKIKQL